MRHGWVRLLILKCLLIVASGCARADVVVLMEEPYGELGHYSPTGHAAVYFDRLCAASVSQLRRCHDGEQGVVISRYHRVAGFDWLAVPPVPYFYAVESRGEIPRTADAAVCETSTGFSISKI